MIENLNRLDKTVEVFCQFIEKLPDTILVKQEWGPKLAIKEGSEIWILAELIPAIESHIRNHHKQLRTYLKKETTR